MNARGILTHVPDFDSAFDSALGVSEIENEIALGTETSIMSSSGSNINVIAILISALIFLAILSWFDFIQVAFYSYMNPEIMKEELPASTKFWLAVLITFLVGMMIILIYYHTMK